MTSEHGGKADRGPLSESMYTAWSTHLTTGLACTLSITREYMEHGGRLPANCNLTVYYLPVYPPYGDYNYGLWLLPWIRFEYKIEFAEIFKLFVTLRWLS
jgi:hypothetical protein